MSPAKKRTYVMRCVLIGLFSMILAAMLAITTIASLEQSIFDVGPILRSDRWFQATLLDAYFGFITFYVWVAYKEQLLRRRLLWFALIMCLGNIAMSIYILNQLVRLPQDEPVSSILVRPKLQSGD